VIRINDRIKKALLKAGLFIFLVHGEKLSKEAVLDRYKQRDKIEKLEMKISIQRDEKYCYLTIKYNALGISDKVLKNLNEGHSSSQESIGGSGKGLTSMRHLLTETFSEDAEITYANLGEETSPTGAEITIKIPLIALRFQKEVDTILSPISDGRPLTASPPLSPSSPYSGKMEPSSPVESPDSKASHIAALSILAPTRKLTDTTPEDPDLASLSNEDSPAKKAKFKSPKITSPSIFKEASKLIDRFKKATTGNPKKKDNK